MEEALLTKKERRLLARKARKAEKVARRNGKGPPSHEVFVDLFLKDLEPLTDNQAKVFDSYYHGKCLMLHGDAGTGKTFISMYLALQEILESKRFKKLVIVRSTEPVRKEGFLPGTAKEKAAVYESPYQAICTQLFGRSDAYHLLKTRGKVEFISTAYIRGITLDDSIILVDEIQNLNSAECNTIITRVGDRSKIMFCGDLRQTDLVKGRETTGLIDFLKIIRKMNSFDVVEFGPKDIVRSGLVRQYILARNDLEDSGDIRPLY